MKREQKSLTNKGFSLVELIIVVAIMAVLIGVLAPQYLRYVEKSRLQKDNTSISEFANVLKMSASEEAVVSKLAAGGENFTFDSDGKLVTTGVTQELLDEIELTMDTGEVKLTSNTYLKGTMPTITLKADSSTKILKVTAVGWMESQTATATTAADPKVF